MKEFNKDNFKFITHVNKQGSKEIIALAKYAGKTIKGIAKCRPEDKYNENTGEMLAALRCYKKILELKLNKALINEDKAYEEMLKAIAYKNKTENVREKTTKEYQEIEERLNLLISAI